MSLVQYTFVGNERRRRNDGHKVVPLRVRRATTTMKDHLQSGTYVSSTPVKLQY